jgi:hypothetical protein
MEFYALSNLDNPVELACSNFTQLQNQGYHHQKAFDTLNAAFIYYFIGQLYH